MKLDTYLSQSIRTLSDAGIGTARLDVLVLLEDLLARDRARLLAHPETELNSEQLRILDEQISRRARHVPLAYIRGKTEFYGRTFLINDFVLEPRPESETMIDQLKKLPYDGPLTVIDVGTGSGALAITAKLELPHADVVAIDIDPHCLEVTRKNAAALHARIRILAGDLLEPIAAHPPDHAALLCNLPYVPDSFQINLAATHEPSLAIFGGPDGLDAYRKLFIQIDSLTARPAYILTEAMPPQHDGLQEIARSHGYRQSGREDFIQVFTPL